MIGRTKDVAARWKAVRNVLGGHLDIGVIEATCERHGFFGALLSEDLETDMAVYNCLLLESAINHARSKSDLFGRDLDFGADLGGEMKLLIEKLNSDWEKVFAVFPEILKLVYSLGKEEKQLATDPSDWVGIVVGD